MKNICKRLLLEVFYKKAFLKNFAIFTGRKWLVISVLWKNLSICHYHVAASYTKTPVLKSLFNSEYCEIFQSTHFEEHLQTAASENVFIKIIHKENKFMLKNPDFFNINIRSKWRCLFLFHDWFPVKFEFIHMQYFFGMVRNRSSHWRCSVGEGVLRNLAKFTGKLHC